MVMLWLIGVSRSVVAIISRIQTKFKTTLYVLLDVNIRSHFHANVKAKLKTIKISGYMTQLPEGCTAAVRICDQNDSSVSL